MKGGDNMRITSKDNYKVLTDIVTCDTIDGINMTYILIGTTTKRPDELFIDLVKVALENDNIF